MKQINLVRVEFLDLFQRTFLKEKDQAFNHIFETFESLADLVENYTAKDQKQRASSFYADFFRLVENKWSSASSYSFEDRSAEFISELEQLLQKQPEKLSFHQSPKRFHIQKEDGFFLTIAKAFKISFYRAGILPLRFKNRVLKLFGKETKKIQFWKHQVPFRFFMEYSLEIRLLAAFNKIYSAYYKEIGNVYLSLSDILYRSDQVFGAPKSNEDQTEQGIHNELNLLLENLKKLHDQTTSKLSEAIESEFEAINDEIRKVGTIEFKNKRLRVSQIHYARKKIRAQYTNTVRSWENTSFAIFDDFRTDSELLQLKHLALEATEEMKSLLETDQYQPGKEIKTLLSQILELKSSINEKESELRKTIVRTKYNVRKLLTQQIIPEVSAKIISRNLGGLIDNLENKVVQFSDLVEKPRVFISSEQYQKPIREQDLSFISLKELISFESLPVFQNHLSAIKSDIFLAVNKVNESIVNLDDIIDFALEAALSNYDDGLADHKEAYKMSCDAFDRAIAQLTGIEEEVQLLNKDKFLEVESAVEDFADSLVSYTENENILALRIRLTKNKAVKKSEEYRDEVIVYLQKSVKKSTAFIIKVYSQFKIGFNWLQNRFLLTAPTPILTREVSDFLYHTHQKIRNLPLIYKNLYQINPVKDQKLFIGREAELSKLDLAFKAWNSGNYASTVLIGEKWGGLTSLVNHYLDTRKLNIKVIRLKADGKLYEESALLQAFSEALDTAPIQSFEDLEKVIHDWPTRIVIVLEDMQKLFLRTLSGFDTLNKLLKVIVRTNEKAYWLNTCTIYAWDYLKKVISVEDYFAHVIYLDKLTDEQIIEIIKIRNRISGVQIEFEPREADAQSRKFRQKSKVEQQEMLARRYFRSLSEFAESNISLALIFWLISTREFNSNKLVIGVFERPDLSFIKVMSMDRLMTIVSLVLHDGLNEVELSMVNHIPLEESQTSLMFLLEDGIVRKSKDRYQVNPVIYRNVITFLKNKNLLQVKS